MNILVQIFVWTPNFNSFRYILWSGTPGSYDNSLTNWRTTKWFSTVVAPCIFPSVVDENCYIRVFQRNKIIRILRQMFSSRIIYFQLLYLSHCCIFNFCVWCEVRVQLHSCMWISIYLTQYHLPKRLFFSLGWFWHPCQDLERFKKTNLKVK